MQRSKSSANSQNASGKSRKVLHPLLASGSSNNISLYKAIKRLMIDAISIGEWEPGQAIAAEWALAERYQVAVGTVRRAVDELVAESILIRQQGRGTFVTAHNRERLMFHFFHIERRDGTKLQPDVKLKTFRRAKADTEEATQLKIPTGSPVFRICNVLSLDKQSIIVDLITIPHSLFAELTPARFRNRPNTIYHLYQTEFGITVVRSAERLRGVLAEGEIAATLGVPTGAPLLEIRRVALSFDNAPVEYRRSLVNTADYEYFSDLAKS